MRLLGWCLILALSLNGLALLVKYRDAQTPPTVINLVDDRVRALEAEKATLERTVAQLERAQLSADANLLICQRTLTGH